MRREGLAAEAEAAVVGAEVSNLACARAGDALAELSRRVSLPCVPAVLAEAAAGRHALDASLAKVASLSDAASDAGDGLPVASLREQVDDRDLDAVRAELADAEARLVALDATLEAAVVEERRSAAALEAHHVSQADTGAVADREAAIADMHHVLERYVGLRLARDLVVEAVRVVREERQVPLVAASGTAFSELTLGEFEGLSADVDARGEPVVAGVRSGGRGTQAVSIMIEGTRDALFLAFRLAAVAAYCADAEPLPMLLDDVLVSFDDRRTEAAIRTLAAFGATTQVLLFTHHRSVATAAGRLVASHRVTVAELGA